MLSIVIQAGGESRRMGEDKALLPFRGQPLIERVINRVRPLADELLVTTNNLAAYERFGLPMFEDIIPGRGALGGLYTALFSARFPLVVVVACDMPLIDPNLILYQIREIQNSGVDVVIPRSEGGLEPFHAVYRRENCLSPIKSALDGDKWRVDAWFNKVKIKILTYEDYKDIDPERISFWNMNTPEDWQIGQQLAEELDN